MDAKLVKIIGTRPSDIPADWPIYNAPRPLVGTKHWTGDFRHGIFYTAVDPTDEYAATWGDKNRALDAWRLEYVTEDQAVAESLAYYQAEYPAEAAEIDPSDADYREWLINAWVDRSRS